MDRSTNPKDLISSESSFDSVYELGRKIIFLVQIEDGLMSSEEVNLLTGHWIK